MFLQKSLHLLVGADIRVLDPLNLLFDLLLFSEKSLVPFLGDQSYLIALLRQPEIRVILP